MPHLLWLGLWGGALILIQWNAVGLFLHLSFASIYFIQLIKLHRLNKPHFSSPSQPGQEVSKPCRHCLSFLLEDSPAELECLQLSLSAQKYVGWLCWRALYFSSACKSNCRARTDPCCQPFFSQTSLLHCIRKKIQVGLPSHYLKWMLSDFHQDLVEGVGGRPKSPYCTWSWFCPRMFFRWVASTFPPPQHIFLLIKTGFGLHFSCRVQQGSN